MVVFIMETAIHIFPSLSSFMNLKDARKKGRILFYTGIPLNAGLNVIFIITIIFCHS